MDKLKIENDSLEKKKLSLEARHSKCIEASNLRRAKVQCSLFIPRTPLKIYKYSPKIPVKQKSITSNLMAKTPLAKIPQNQTTFFGISSSSQDSKFYQNNFVNFLTKIPKYSSTHEEKSEIELKVLQINERIKELCTSLGIAKSVIQIETKMLKKNIKKSLNNDKDIKNDQNIDEKLKNINLKINVENTTKTVLNNSMDMQEVDLIQNSEENQLKNVQKNIEIKKISDIQNNNIQTKVKLKVTEINERIKELFTSLGIKMPTIHINKKLLESNIRKSICDSEDIDRNIEEKLKNMDLEINDKTLTAKPNYIENFTKPMEYIFSVNDTVNKLTLTAKNKEDDLNILMETSENIIRNNEKHLGKQNPTESKLTESSKLSSNQKQNISNALQYKNYFKSTSKQNRYTTENISRALKTISQQHSTCKNSLLQKTDFKSTSKQQNGAEKICDNEILTRYNNSLLPCAADSNTLGEKFESSINDVAIFSPKTCNDMDSKEKEAKVDMENFTINYSNHLDNFPLRPFELIKEESLGLIRIRNFDQINSNHSTLLKNSENLQPQEDLLIKEINSTTATSKNISTNESSIKIETERQSDSQLLNENVLISSNRSDCKGLEVQPLSGDAVIKEETTINTELLNLSPADKNYEKFTKQQQHNTDLVNPLIGPSSNSDKNCFDKNFLISTNSINNKALTNHLPSSNAANSNETIAQLTEFDRQTFMNNPSQTPKIDRHTFTKQQYETGETLSQRMQIDHQTSTNQQSEIRETSTEILSQRMQIYPEISSEQSSNTINPIIKMNSQDSTIRKRLKLSENTNYSINTAIETPLKQNEFSSIQHSSKQLNLETTEASQATIIDFQLQTHNKLKEIKATHTSLNSNSIPTISKQLNYQPTAAIGETTQSTAIHSQRNMQIRKIICETTNDYLTDLISQSRKLASQEQMQIYCERFASNGATEQNHAASRFVNQAEPQISYQLNPPPSNTIETFHLESEYYRRQKDSENLQTINQPILQTYPSTNEDPPHPNRFHIHPKILAEKSNSETSANTNLNYAAATISDQQYLRYGIGPLPPGLSNTETATTSIGQYGNQKTISSASLGHNPALTSRWEQQHLTHHHHHHHNHVTREQQSHDAKTNTYFKARKQTQQFSAYNKNTHFQARKQQQQQQHRANISTLPPFDAVCRQYRYPNYACIADILQRLANGLLKLQNPSAENVLQATCHNPDVYLVQPNTILPHPQSQPPLLTFPPQNELSNYPHLFPSQFPNEAQNNFSQYNSTYRQVQDLRPVYLPQTQTSVNEGMSNHSQAPQHPAQSTQLLAQYQNPAESSSIHHQHPNNKTQSCVNRPLLVHKPAPLQVTSPPAYPIQPSPLYYKQPQFVNPALKSSMEYPLHVNSHNMHPHHFMNQNSNFGLRPTASQHSAYNNPNLTLSPPADSRMSNPAINTHPTTPFTQILRPR